LLLAGGLAGGLLLAGAPLASAQSAPVLTGHITDQAGVLGSDHSRVQSAMDDLLSHQNVELWLLIVPSLNGMTAPDLASGTFTANGFGGNDAVLVIAVKDHRYGWAEDTATGLPIAQVQSLVDANATPLFANGYYADGIIDFVAALGQKIDSVRAPVATPATQATQAGPGSAAAGTGSSPDNSGLTTVLWAVIAILLIGCGIAVLMLWIRSWRRGRMTAEERDKQTGDLARQANKLLVDTDDALQQAVQEVGFAQAEFADSDVKPYSDAVAAAQAELKAAFAIKQQLDDSTPEDDATRAKMYGDIIAHCQAANAKVDEQAKRLDTLRDLEKTAPAALAALPNAIDALQARLPEIQAAQKTLSGYAPTSWAAVKGNAEEADKRGHFAETQVAAGKAALAATPPDSAGAARAARAAQEAVAQANQLLDAIVQLAAALDDARGKINDEIAAADADIAAAKKAIDAAPPNAPMGPSAADLAKAESLLTGARKAGTEATPDPIAALKAVQAAHASADQVLSGVRDASTQQQRSAAAYLIAHQSANASITQARSYVATRSDGVGTQARTRLAEAERHMAQCEALAATDLDGAVREASTAHELAEEAISLANVDFTTYDRRGGSGVSGSPTPGYRPPPGSGSGSFGGAILGGIVGGMLSGGGRRGGGFGGTPWGSGGGWTGGGAGRSGGLGGFGGFGGGGVHSGGGGWSGGGGGGVHSGGGGW
jgi:uncharacterized membrane protein YgcG